jgi:hypothetical protein
VPASLCGEKRRAKERELLRLWRDHLRGSASKSPKWKTTYWKAGKAGLKKDSGGKCAYCESPTDVVAHGDVEHYRPKAIYWWLVYCLDNHLFACQICNQTYKGDSFPLPKGTRRMKGPSIKAGMTEARLDALVDTFAPDPIAINSSLTLKSFLAASLAEQPGLPDPYNMNPQRFFRWEADDTNKEVWIRPRTRSARHRFITESCDEFLGLNREELRRWRWLLAYKPLANYRTLLQELDGRRGTDKARKITEAAVRAMMGDDQPYAAMVRYFVNEKWKLSL